MINFMLRLKTKSVGIDAKFYSAGMWNNFAE